MDKETVDQVIMLVEEYGVACVDKALAEVDMEEQRIVKADRDAYNLLDHIRHALTEGKV